MKKIFTAILLGAFVFGTSASIVNTAFAADNNQQRRLEEQNRKFEEQRKIDEQNRKVEEQNRKLEEQRKTNEQNRKLEEQRKKEQQRKLEEQNRRLKEQRKKDAKFHDNKADARQENPAPDNRNRK